MQPTKTPNPMLSWASKDLLLVASTDWLTIRDRMTEQFVLRLRGAEQMVAFYNAVQNGAVAELTTPEGTKAIRYYSPAVLAVNDQRHHVFHSDMSDICHWIALSHGQEIRREAIRNDELCQVTLLGDGAIGFTVNAPAETDQLELDPEEARWLAQLMLRFAANTGRFKCEQADAAACRDIRLISLVHSSHDEWPMLFDDEMKFGDRIALSPTNLYSLATRILSLLEL